MTVSIERHIELELAALLRAKAPHVYQTLAARVRFYAKVRTFVFDAGTARRCAQRIIADVAPVCARYAAVDTAIGLAGLYLPYLVVRLLIDFAVADVYRVRSFVLDNIAIRALRAARRRVC